MTCFASLTKRLLWIAFLMAMPSVVFARRADVLVVYSQSRTLTNVEIDAGLTRPGDLLPSARVQFFTEYLDYPNLSGEEDEQRIAQSLAEKYAQRPPKLLVAGGMVALKFLLRFRESMFPEVPLIYFGVDKHFLSALPQLPPDTRGVPVEYDVDGTIGLAMQLQPNARRLVVITGASPWSAARRLEVQSAMEKRKNPLATEFWTTLSTDELSKRLHELGPDDIVFTPEYYCVSSGQTLPPTDSVRMLVSSSSAPIYTIFSGQLGSGVVGGSMNTLADMGRATRALIDEILEGQVTDHNEVRAPTAMVQLDWRQLRQWNIPEARIPPNAIVHFRPPSLLELYRSQPVVGAFICIAQGALIVALLFERRRRQKTAKALAQSQKQATDVARAARLTFFEWNFDGAAPVGPSRKPSCAPNFTKNEFERVIDEVHPSDREHLRSAVQHAIDRGEELNLEYRTLGPDGRPSWVSVRGHAAPNGQARIAGFCMDINDRKLEQLQSAQDRAALTQMARVSTMGQLSAAIAHQLNQPLMAILCNAETARKMLGRNEPSLEELKRILSDIVEENVRAGDIIRNLTALYRNGVTDRTAFDLNELVLETAELLRAELTARNVVTRVELAPELPAFDGSRIQIQQVLFNLMLNAADAMAETKIGHRLLILRSAMKNESLQICVIDHGDGITPTALERIFQPFWTTKPQGVGVGLTISRTIVEAHGGSLCASNRLEGGAQFCLSLPAQTAT